MPLAELIEQYVLRHNEGVRLGDFGALMELFDANAELRVERPGVGPFIGIDAIRSAFASNPPDDELILTNVTIEHPAAQATYCWAAEPARPAGALHFHSDGNKLTRVSILFSTN